MSSIHTCILTMLLLTTRKTDKQRDVIKFDDVCGSRKLKGTALKRKVKQGNIIPERREFDVLDFRHKNSGKTAWRKVHYKTTEKV